MEDLQLAGSFNEINYNEIYNQLKSIQETIFLLEPDPDLRFLNWSELEILRRVMNEHIRSRNVPKKVYLNDPNYDFNPKDYHVGEDQLDDEDEFYSLLIVNTNYDRTRKVLLSRDEKYKEWSEIWCKERKIQAKSYDERLEFLNDSVKKFRNKITREIALETFKLSLLFCRKYLNKHYYHI